MYDMERRDMHNKEAFPSVPRWEPGPYVLQRDREHVLQENE